MGISRAWSCDLLGYIFDNLKNFYVHTMQYINGSFFPCINHFHAPQFFIWFEEASKWNNQREMTWANDNNDIKRPVFGFSVLLKCDNLTKEGSQVLCVQRPPLPWNFETKWCPGLIQSAWSEHTIWFDKIFFLKKQQN